MLTLLKKFSIRENSFFKWGLAILFITIPLYPKFPIFNIPKTYVAVRLEDFLIVILGLFLVLHLLFNKQVKLFFQDKINQSIFLFTAVGLVSLVSGIFLTQTVIPHLGLLHWIRRLEYITPFLLIASFTIGPPKVRFFCKVLFWAVFLIFLYGVGQKYFDFPVISTQNQEFSKGLALRLVPGARLHSTFGGHYDLAAFLTLVFPMLFAYLLTLKNWANRVLLILMSVLPAFWLLMQTESRISFVAYLVGVTITLLLIKRKLFIIPFVVLSIILMFLVSDLGNRYLYTLDVYKQRILNKVKLNLAPDVILAAAPTRLNSNQQLNGEKEMVVIEDRSTSIRFNMEWPRALRSFYKNPLLGTGYSSITLATDNDYLRLLGEVGLLGALSFFLILTRLFSRIVKFFAIQKDKLDINTAFVGGFVGSLVGMLINATFIDVFEASKVAIIFWGLAGMAIAIVKQTNEKQV